MKFEYIIEEKTERNGWCLFTLCAGSDDREYAERKLAEAKAKNPNRELRLGTVEKENWWWWNGCD